jgi:hypothetical protein
MTLQWRKTQVNVQIMALNNRITFKLTIMWYSGAQNGRLNFVRLRLEFWDISQIFGKFLHLW